MSTGEQLVHTGLAPHRDAVMSWPRLRLAFALVHGRTFAAGRMRVALASLAATAFFLFTAGYTFPGGAYHFTNYAEMLLSGGVSAELAQRDIGFALLLVLGGYPLTHSFIGITLIHALFAFLMPILAYEIIGSAWRRTALWTALALMASAAPYIYLKMIHHDHAYIFFSLLTLFFAVKFLRTTRAVHLYAMTFALLAASFTRPAGNILLVVVLGVLV